MLSDLNSTQTTFLCVRVRTEDSVERVVGPNAAIWSLWSQRMGYDTEEYQRVMKEHLASGEPVPVGRMTPENWSCTIVTRCRPVPGVDELASRGRLAFVETYFKRVAWGGKEHYVEKGIESREERAAVIAKLFEWQIACSADCESGYLVLHGTAEEIGKLLRRAP